MYKTYNNHVVLALIAGFVDDMVWLYLPAIHQDILSVHWTFLLFFESKFFISFIRYFKTKDGLYGLSCFERIAVDSVAERGARMKSVGILCAKYTSLHEHMPFLEEEVRYAISIINPLILVIYIMTLYFSILFFYTSVGNNKENRYIFKTRTFFAWWPL